MLAYGRCECFVMQMVYVCVLCASCSSSQCCVLHDLQFVNAGRGCKRRPYGRGILPQPLNTEPDVSLLYNPIWPPGGRYASVETTLIPNNYYSVERVVSVT